MKERADELSRDLALVRAIYDSGADDEADVCWCRLVPGMSNKEAKRRFEQLTKRVPLAVDSLSFEDVVDRLLVLLGRAMRDKEN